MKVPCTVRQRTGNWMSGNHGFAQPQLTRVHVFNTPLIWSIQIQASQCPAGESSESTGQHLVSFGWSILPAEGSNYSIQQSHERPTGCHAARGR